MGKKQESPRQNGPTPGGTTTNVFKRFSRYVDESRLELRKVSWPTLVTTKRASLAVLAFVAIMAVLLGLIDLCLSSIIKTLLS